MKLTSLLLLLPLVAAAAAPVDEEYNYQDEEAGGDLEARHWQGSCPTCIPYPESNKCDITTSCIPITGHRNWHGGWHSIPNYCACRHGYRGDGVAKGDTSKQWRMNWSGQEGRVFVKPGVVCNTLCDHYELGKDGCKEVPIKYICL